jgi:hypothetical protein
MKLATTKLVLVEWPLKIKDRNFDAFLAGLVDGHERDEACNNRACTGGDDANIQCSKLLHTEGQCFLSSDVYLSQVTELNFLVIFIGIYRIGALPCY